MPPKSLASKLLMGMQASQQQQNMPPSSQIACFHSQQPFGPGLHQLHSILTPPSYSHVGTGGDGSRHGITPCSCQGAAPASQPTLPPDNLEPLLHRLESAISTSAEGTMKLAESIEHVKPALDRLAQTSEQSRESVSQIARAIESQSQLMRSLQASMLQIGRGLERAVSKSSSCHASCGKRPSRSGRGGRGGSRGRGGSPGRGAKVHGTISTEKQISAKELADVVAQDEMKRRSVLPVDQSALQKASDESLGVAASSSHLPEGFFEEIANAPSSDMMG